MDAVTLSRLQFAITIGFHFIFVSINMGMAWMLVILETLGWRNKDGDLYVQAAKSFSKLFGLTFVAGVATGIVMEFQFGTNWAGYSRFVGNIFGTLLSSEALMAFFLESAFIALYLFGRDRVSKRVHWFSILTTASAMTISAFWILSANSWQQTPAGHIIRNGKAELVSFTDVVFNPSGIFRFLHTVDATLITGTFFIGGIAACMLLRNKDNAAARKTMKVSLILGFIFSVIQVAPLGHEHAIQVAMTQPEKFAVFEAVYETQTHAPLVIFGIPASNPPHLKARIEIPGLLSYITFGDLNRSIKGINEFPPDEIPPLFLPFVSFHTMVFLGFYFILITFTGAVLLYKNRLWENRIFLNVLKLSLPLPVIASELGWIAAEVGRQPWIVYKILKTKDAVSPNLSGGEVLFSLILFCVLYLFIGVLYIRLARNDIRRVDIALQTEK